MINADAKKILTIASFLALFLFILVYAVFRSSNLIFGVKIKNVDINGSPLQSGATVTNNVLKVTGVAQNAVDLTLDGREISVDQAGNFSETVALLSGYNIISLRAVDKFGKTDEKDYQLIY
jgi:hypothetical protein